MHGKAAFNEPRPARRTLDVPLCLLYLAGGWSKTAAVVLSDHLLRNWLSLDSLQQRTTCLLSEPERGRPPSTTPPPQHQKRLTAAERIQLVQAYKAGATILELAESYGIARTTVMTHLNRMAVPRRVIGADLINVQQAAELYEAGASLKDLGQRYGCHPETVRNALLRAGVTMRPRPGWKH
jgi:transposase-like protein